MCLVLILAMLFCCIPPVALAGRSKACRFFVPHVFCLVASVFDVIFVLMSRVLLDGFYKVWPFDRDAAGAGIFVV